MTRTITITSGKGGVGKTNISVNLALHLAALGHRTCLFDADLGLANVNTLLGLYPDYNLEDVILSRCDLEDMIMRNYQGIDIIHGSSGVERMASLEAGQIGHVIDSFSELHGYDFLLFDTSAGVSKNVVSFCLASSEVIVVITPDLTSLTEAYALLRILCLNGFKGTVKIVVNQCKGTSIAGLAYAKFKEIVEGYLPVDLVLLGTIVQDPKVEEAVKQRKAFTLLYPESNASECVKGIAQRLVENQPEDLEPSSGMFLFWTKCLKRLTSPLKLTGKKKEKKEPEAEPADHIQEQEPLEVSVQETAEEPPPEALRDVPRVRWPGDPEHVPHVHVDAVAHEDLPDSKELPPRDERHVSESVKTPMDLPTLPHVVLKLIEGCNREGSSIQSISEIISKDPSLSAKVLRMANATRSRQHDRMADIEAAVLFLGRDVIKTVVMSAAAHSDLGQAEGDALPKLKLFWRHSLMCGVLARLIAEKTAYPAPNEAFLSGLLHDIGKLVLWVDSSEKYAEALSSSGGKPDSLLAGETRLGAAHCEAGASVISECGLSSFVADAVLYHHEPVHRIMDALPLVKIVFVAHDLCPVTAQRIGTGFEVAGKIFGFSPAEVEALVSIAEQEVKQAAESLGIEIEPPIAVDGSVLDKDAERGKDLVRTVKDIYLLHGTFQNLLEADGEASVLKVIRQGLQVLFNIRSILFFLVDQERNVLVGKYITGDQEDDPTSDLEIPFQEEKSLLAMSLRRQTVVDSFSRSTQAAPAIVDEQLIRFLGKDGMLCLPLVARGTDVGVIALGIDEHQMSCLRDQVNLLTMFANQAASALTADHVRQNEANRLRDVLNKIKAVLDEA